MKEENKLDINNMWEIYKSLLLSTKRKGIKEFVDWLDNTDFKVAPASTRFHNCIEGGLLAHSLNVYNEARRQKDLIKLFGLSNESIILTSLLHDVCKVNYYTMEYRNKKINGAWVQEPFYAVDDLYPIGHGEKSVILLLQNHIELSDVEIAMIRNHMGFSKDEPNQVSSLFNKYPESIIIHNADLIATFILESPGMLENFSQGLQEYVEKV